jgi:hypothetical protein
MMDALIPEQVIPLTLYTDAYVVRGTARSRYRRLSDVLNHAEDGFIVISDASYEEFGTRSQQIHTEFAQVNLGTVLFAVADATIEPLPELRTPKIAERALVTIPPFKIVGAIHLLPERDLRNALTELTGHFVPITDAMYWSDVVAEPRTSAPMVAVNHARAQILAPHREVDPWEGLTRAGSEGEAPLDEAPARTAEAPQNPAPPSNDPTGW